MPQDIIDNRNEKLIDNVTLILEDTEQARFAVGYFFLSGFIGIAEALQNVTELRLLIGNTSTRETIEQLAEGYRQLESVAEIHSARRYSRVVERKIRARETAQNLRACIEFMPQTDASAQLIKTLVEMIASGQLKVKVYTKERLHAKAYIFDYGQNARYESGISIVGSSNLTLAGLASNTELNVVVHGNANQTQLRDWFDALWDEAEDFDKALMDEMQTSWALAPVRPYDIYMKTLYELVKDRVEADESRIAPADELTAQLADFQQVAVSQAIRIIDAYGGVFISDVVGLGKSYIGSAIVKHFEQVAQARPLILCPPALISMWESYNAAYRLGAQILSTGLLSSGEENARELLSEDIRYRHCDFILVDESHNFRNANTQRYRVLQEFLTSGDKKCCFLTATPRNKSAWDIYHQLRLFHLSDETQLPLDTPALRDYFRLIESGERSLPALLQHILIRRTRNHILRWYGYDAETDEPVEATQFADYLSRKRRAYVRVGDTKQFFPKRVLKTIEYSIEDTYQGLYAQIRDYLGKSDAAVQLTYARYGLWHYVKSERQHVPPYQDLQSAGRNLRGLMRILLFKRFESSIHAFKTTISRFHNVHVDFLHALDNGIVPAGDDAQKILYEASTSDETDISPEERDIEHFLAALREASAQYDIRDFNVPELRQAIQHDIGILNQICEKVQHITPAQDAKLQKLKALLASPSLQGKKRLIFTQYIDTASYLYENLQAADTEVIHSHSSDRKQHVVDRFAPNANSYRLKADETEIKTLIATDVLAEGLNLQDCGMLINYDLHWNPVRLIQRFGRIDRIGSQFDEIHGFNFLPELGIERNLGLREKLQYRIQEIHDTIGEDAAILDNSEQLNERAMYAIYEQNGEQLSLLAEETEEPGFGLSEAEELLRQLKRQNPAEYQRIAELRDGIRTGIPAEVEGTYVFCRAGQNSRLVLLDENGVEQTTDVSEILRLLQCDADLQGKPLPTHHNARVTQIQKAFAEEIRQGQNAFPKQTLSRAQGYILRELRMLSNTSEEGAIGTLERAFRGRLTESLKREINRLYRHKVVGEELLTALKTLYHRHNLAALESDETQPALPVRVPSKVICSAAFVKLA